MYIFGVIEELVKKLHSSNFVFNEENFGVSFTSLMSYEHCLIQSESV